MKIKEAIELFENETMFVFEKKEFVIDYVKEVSGKLIVVTNQRTFTKWESEINDFLNEIEFKKTDGVATQHNPMVIKPQENYKNYLPVNIDGLMLPNSSMKAKDKLDELLAHFDDPTKITDDFMKKANALCTITDKIISVEKLQLDFVKLQKN
ncbi:hypothetical protein P3875_04265 [Myroides sp. JBRI-B21084]|uniref:hypothetical protein n=1 Tax=Myroides sp. JBRI-B21084 TaxID=3119977 RepID=UPI0026E40BA1|nr:hypothetical protein [Paenimyroides cloacae]WKW47287.1 hypothetical protein P3875_04265 [Paenimyroides cloacae]